jgi:hypothetical protein
MSPRLQSLAAGCGEACCRVGSDRGSRPLAIPWRCEQVRPTPVPVLCHAQGEAGDRLVEKISAHAQRFRCGTKSVGQSDARHRNSPDFHVISVPRGYVRARLGAIARNPEQRKICGNLAFSNSCDSHGVARGRVRLRLKPLLTGWSLVRIRPGEPNLTFGQSGDFSDR